MGIVTTITIGDKYLTFLSRDALEKKLNEILDAIYEYEYSQLVTLTSSKLDVELEE